MCCGTAVQDVSTHEAAAAGEERGRWGGGAAGREAARLSPDGTLPSAGAGGTDGCGQGQGTVVRSVPPHEAAGARKERRATRREAARKLKLFGFKFSDKILILTTYFEKESGERKRGECGSPRDRTNRPTGSATGPRGPGANAVLLIPDQSSGK